jgi:hypothetical protein
VYVSARYARVQLQTAGIAIANVRGDSLRTRSHSSPLGVTLPLEAIGFNKSLRMVSPRRGADDRISPIMPHRISEPNFWKVPEYTAKWPCENSPSKEIQHLAFPGYSLAAIATAVYILVTTIELPRVENTSTSGPGWYGFGTLEQARRTCRLEPGRFSVHALAAQILLRSQVLFNDWTL